jgi:hypothetical protein
VEWIPGAGKDQPRVFTGICLLYGIYVKSSCRRNLL